MDIVSIIIIGIFATIIFAMICDCKIMCKNKDIELAKLQKEIERIKAK